VTAPAEPKKRSWTGVIKYVIGVGLLAFVIWSNWKDKPELLKGEDGKPVKDGEAWVVAVDAAGNTKVEQPGLEKLLERQPNWPLYGLCGLLCAGVVASQYVRWYVLVRALELPFTLRNAFRLGMVGTFYNTFLPGAIGGDLVKAFFIAKGQPGRRAAAVSTVVADRALGLFGLLVFGGVVGGGAWMTEASGERGGQISSNPTLQWIIIGSLIAAFMVAFGYFALGWVSPAAAERIDAKLKGVRKVGPTLAELFETGLRYRRRPRAVFLGVLLSAVGHLLMMMLFHFAVQIFPPADLSLIGTFAEHVIIAPIGYIVQAVVPLPGGLGVAELSFGGLYELIRPGGGRTVGLTGRLALRVIEWTLGGVCYIVYLTMKAELPAEPSKEEVEAAAKLEAVEK
jgi:uncharacterized protein (TIRG00374 family)